MAEVFISYASADKDVAFRISAYLEEQGISCWIAPRDVPPGGDYGVAILEGIEGSAALVLILSEEANDSTFVRKEVERAVSKGKPVLPVRIREVAPAGALEFFISSSQWVDAWRSPMEQHLSKLSDAIRALRGDGAPQPATSPVAAARRGRRAPAIAGGAVVAVAAAGVALWLWQPWLAPWQKSVPDFLAGSWCRPMSGDAYARFDFVRAGADEIRGEVRFSHSTDVVRARAKTEAKADGFVLHWSEPEPWVSGGPTPYRIVDEISIEALPEDPKTADPSAAPAVWTRCAPGNGG